MRLSLGVAAVVGTLAIGGLPAAAGLIGAATPAPAPSTTSTAASTGTPTGEHRDVERRHGPPDADGGHGPPDHAQAWGWREQRGLEPGADRGPAVRDRAGRRHGERMSAIGRRHGVLMRSWARCVRGAEPAGCGDKPTPPGHLKHPGSAPWPR